MATVRNIIGEKPVVCRQQCGDGLEVSPHNDQDRLWQCPLGRYGVCPVEKSIRRRKNKTRYRNLRLWKRSHRHLRDLLAAWALKVMARSDIHKFFLRAGWPPEWHVKIDNAGLDAEALVYHLARNDARRLREALDAYLLELCPFTPKQD